MRPQVVATTPFNGATDVPVNAVVEIEANEPIDPATVNSNSFLVRDNTTFQTVPGSFSVSTNGRVVAFLPAAPFAVGRSHSVFFSSRGMTDVSGNRLTGPSLFFTTDSVEDTTPPQVVGVSPDDGLTGVPTNAKVVIAFDEPIQGTDGNLVTLSAGGVDVPVKRLLSNGNRRLTLTPLNLLDPLTAHDVTVDGVMDLSGTALAVAELSSFTTGGGVDLVNVSVTSRSPAANATNVSTDTATESLPAPLANEKS